MPIALRISFEYRSIPIEIICDNAELSTIEQIVDIARKAVMAIADMQNITETKQNDGKKS